MAGLAAAAACSGLEVGLYATSRLRVALDAAAGQAAALAIQRSLAELPLVLTLLLVVNNLAQWLVSRQTQVLLERWQWERSGLIGTVLVTGVLFVFSESVPKSAFHRWKHELLYPAAPGLSLLRLLLGWTVWPLARASDRLAARLVARDRGSPGRPTEREALLSTGAAEGLMSPFQQRVARGVLALRGRRAADEARPVTELPTARLGQEGVTLPAGTREHRVRVLDEAGERVAGWVPLAALWTRGGFRAPARRDLRAVARVEPGAGLDRVYVALDRSDAPFAMVLAEGRPTVIDVDRLRLRVMGMFSDGG
jgi:CBS domain containing-hemolysin-like protein